MDEKIPNPTRNASNRSRLTYKTFETTTAIMVDGGFYHKRATAMWGEKTPEDRTSELIDYCYRHLKADRYEHRRLYRIFYYDCPPANKNVYHPLLKKQINLGNTDLYKWRNTFLEQLRNRRKVALRLGVLSELDTQYVILPRVMKKLLNGSLTIDQLAEGDFTLNITQKGVDTRIGLDIASMALKKQVSQVILISADSDFIPIAKFARREGIDFILDPMWTNIKDGLNEHIDGRCSPCQKPQQIFIDTEE